MQMNLLLFVTEAVSVCTATHDSWLTLNGLDLNLTSMRHYPMGDPNAWPSFVTCIFFLTPMCPPLLIFLLTQFITYLFSCHVHASASLLSWRWAHDGHMLTICFTGTQHYAQSLCITSEQFCKHNQMTRHPFQWFSPVCLTFLISPPNTTLPSLSGLLGVPLCLVSH